MKKKVCRSGQIIKDGKKQGKDCEKLKSGGRRNEVKR